MHALRTAWRYIWAASFWSNYCFALKIAAREKSRHTISSDYLKTSLLSNDNKCIIMSAAFTYLFGPRENIRIVLENIRIMLENIRIMLLLIVCQTQCGIQIQTELPPEGIRLPHTCLIIPAAIASE